MFSRPSADIGHSNIGRVYLVGAGPGDPGLITLRGVECLSRADVVLYDYLVNPHILRHAPQAECISLGQHGRGRIWSQQEINERMIAEARRGHTVVRLKGGDPAVFARAAEETTALQAAGVPFELVPGITAALAAASYAGIAFTHRDWSSAVALVTAQQQDDAPQSALDYGALAAFPGTLVFYMGVTTAHDWTARLIEGGMPAETPSAIIRRCSFPDQQVIRVPLVQVAQAIDDAHLRPPVIVVVGQAALGDEALDWFSRRPLFGRRILVTRPQQEATSLGTRLAELGAEVLYHEAIVISDPADWSEVDAALARLDEYHWLVFSSATGVRMLLDRLAATGQDVRRLGGVRIAAIGPGTAEELARYRLRADLVPDEYRAEALADALAPQAAGKRFLLARASRGREVLAERLRAAGATVDQVVVYLSTDPPAAEPQIVEKLVAARIDWTTVTSSAIARSLVTLFGDELKKTKLVSISPVTSAALVELGCAPHAEAKAYTMAGVVEAILAAETH
ncbi:MAG: uroporphyrinogen-III C-methyltransferase [Pirellulales bacterium]